MLQLFLVLFKCQTCVLIDTVSFSRFTQCSDHCISRFLACIPFSVYTVILLTQLAGSTFSLCFLWHSISRRRRMISKVLLPTSRWKTPRTSHGLMLQLFLFLLRPSLVSCKYEICRLPNTFALRAVYGSLHVHFCCIYPLHCIPSCFQHSCSMHVVNFPFVAVCLLLGASDGHSHDWFGFLSRFFCPKCAHQDFLQLRDLQCGQPHPAFAGHRFCRLHHSAINQSFRRSSFLPPKAKVLGPDVRIHAPVPSGWRAFNVQGDGRCGYRALAKFLGISWTDVMQRLLPLMLAAQHTFQPHELMAFVMAMDPANPCSRAAWLSHRHILLLSQLRDWFPDGIAVRKLHAGLDFIHFQPDGDVQLASHISSASVCVLGLLSIRAPHFVLLHSTPFEKSRAGLLGRSSALPAARAMQPSSLDFAGGSFACMVPTNFEDRPLRFASAERSWSLALPEQQLVTFTLRSLLSGAHLCTVTLPVSDLWNRSLHMVLIKVIANVLQASPFHLRLFASSDVVCPTPTGPQLAPLVSVKLLRIH